MQTTLSVFEGVSPIIKLYLTTSYCWIALNEEDSRCRNSTNLDHTSSSNLELSIALAKCSWCLVDVWPGGSITQLSGQGQPAVAVAAAATPAAALQIQFLISFKEQEVGRSFVTQTWAGLLLL